MKLNRKTKNILIVIALIFMIIYAIDVFISTNYINKLIINDQEAPVINISELPKKHLINRDFDYEQIKCTDNHDEICNVIVNGTFDTSVSGQQTIILEANNSSSNKKTKNYTFTIVENVDGSMYIP